MLYTQNTRLTHKTCGFPKKFKNSNSDNKNMQVLQNTGKH